MTPYRITHLAGSARSGSDRAGHIAHVVIDGRALCGKEPGRHSAGWSEYGDQEITCPKCLQAITHCAYCGNLLEPDEGHSSRYYRGLICDGCADLEK